MKTIIENRASTILYNTILSNNLNKGLILLPANICPIVPATLHKTETKFKFYDINANDLLPDTNELKSILRNETGISAILYNHSFGIENNPEIIFKEIKFIKKDIFIINDCCLLKPKLNLSETNADLTLFSTGYSKYVDFGKGGFAFLNNRLNYNHFYSSFDKNNHEILVHDFNTALSSKKQFIYSDSNWLDTEKTELVESIYFKNIEKKIKKVDKHKSLINNIYTSTINKKFQLEEKYNNWRYNIIVNNKDFVLKKIFENNLFASSHYQSLVGIFGDGTGTNAEHLHSKVINLFNDFRFNEEKAIQISKIINKHAN